MSITMLSALSRKREGNLPCTLSTFPEHDIWKNEALAGMFLYLRPPYPIYRSDIYITKDDSCAD